MALIVWAAILEWQRPRRGVSVLVMLSLAGLLRPEAWFLAAMYWCWVAWKATWRQRFIYAALAASGPLIWCAVDYVVTGDPMFSLNYTSASAEDLGRQRPLSELPAAIPGFFENLVKLPVFAAAGVGLVLGVVISPRRMLMPIVVLVAGLITFVAHRRRGRVRDRALPGRPGARADGARGGRDRRLDDARSRAGCGPCGWSARSRSSSSASASRPRA